MSRAALALAFAGATLLALVLRLPQLDRRPMHQDEAVHAIKFQELWETGRYIYDPRDFHGPTIYYAALPIAWMSGVRSFAETSEWTFRLVTVIFGVGLILLLPLVADGLGRAATAWAALLTAASPAFAFYSRYYIQETPLVFFTFAAIACGWRFLRSGRAAWAGAAPSPRGDRASRKYWKSGDVRSASPDGKKKLHGPCGSRVETSDRPTTTKSTP